MSRFFIRADAVRAMRAAGMLSMVAGYSLQVVRSSDPTRAGILLGGAR